MPELLPVQSILFQNLLRDFQIIAPPRVPVWWMSDIIQPVALVNSQVTLEATLSEAAMQFATNGTLVAPIAGAIMAGTGQLPAGRYLFRIYVNWADNNSQSCLIQHRDAADAANIWEHELHIHPTMATRFTEEWVEDLSANERIRLVVRSVAAVATRYAGIIWRRFLS